MKSHDMTRGSADIEPRDDPHHAEGSSRHSLIINRQAAHRREDIQGLRAVAVSLVVAFHAGLPVRGGFIGVDVFFVISGFVITGVLLRQWAADGRIDFRAFYARRLRRLLPALALVVTTTCVASLLLQASNGAQQQTAKTALGAMLISANVVIPRSVNDYFAPRAADNPLLHTWSLSVEEQYYLVFPALLLFALLLTRHRRNPIAGLAIVVSVIAMASLGIELAATYATRVLGAVSTVAVPPFYSSVGRAWEFAVGALVALGVPRLQRCAPRTLLSIGWAGLFGLVSAAMFIGPMTTFPGVAALAPVVATAGLLVSGVARPHALGRGLGAAPLVWLGDRSYALYLWHWPVIVFAVLLFPTGRTGPMLGAAVSLLAAAWSYRSVENPIRVSSRLRGRSLAAVLGVAAAVPIGTGALLGVGARIGWGQPWALGAHIVVRKNCDAGEFDPDRCRWTVPQAQGFVLLIGDSQASAIADGVVPAAARLQYDVVVASHNACAFAVLPAGDALFQSGACADRNRRLLEYAVARHPRVVAIANESPTYATKYRNAWRASIAFVTRELRAAGVGVLIIEPAPIADAQATRQAWLIRPGDRSTSMSVQRAWRYDAVESDRLAAAENPGTMIFDPASVLCDNERCSIVRDAVPLYTDQNHLSRPGALLLAPALQDALQRAAVQSRVTSGATMSVHPSP